MIRHARIQIGDSELRDKLFGEVHLHLGAHRTGSTSFQTLLSENYHVIQSQGVRVGFARRHLAPYGQLEVKLPHKKLSKDKRGMVRQFLKVRSEIAPVVRKGFNQQALLSEENLIGVMRNFEKGRFYPSAHARMTYLRNALFPSAIGNVLMLVRSYDSFFESAFRKRAEVNALPEFSEVAKLQTEFVGGWPDVVDQVLDALRPRELIVAAYGRERDDLALLGQLCPTLRIAEMKRPGKWANTSFSDRALFECQRRLNAGEVLSREESRVIRDEFADAPADRPFANFLPEQASKLKERYQADLDVLRRHSGITLIDA